MKKYYLLFAAALGLVIACNPDDDKNSSGASLMTKEEIALETYSGGKLGTTFNASASAYEDPTEAVSVAGMDNEFKYGEYFFERTFNTASEPFAGLGPAYVRSSCIDCHPGYGYGKRVDRYRANDYGNGYLLVVYNKATEGYVSSVAGMPQTKANGPFKAPIDENQITIDWLPYTDEWGNKFPDGETYSLIYPEVNIPLSAFYGGKVLSGDKELAEGEYGVKLESTIGIYGTGLLDAIDDDDLKAQYLAEETYFKQAFPDSVMINPGIFKDGEWVSMYSNSRQGDGTKHAKKFTYALSRGPILDAAGANAIWNITNVTRSDRRYHYLNLSGDYYARLSSQDPEVQASFYEYFPLDRYEAIAGVAPTGNVEQDIYNYLTSTNLPAEMSDNDYADFMIWHRGLAVPAARDLDKPQVQKGRKLFREIGCATCHKPSWETGDDNVYDPNLFFVNGRKTVNGKQKVVPVYPHQTIWPYTDMIQHKLYMKNDIRTGWCRTTPLWGRGLSLIVAGHQDRLHDRRARNVTEAIMWHGSKGSHARASVEKYRSLSKEDRDAVVAFIDAI